MPHWLFPDMPRSPGGGPEAATWQNPSMPRASWNQRSRWGGVGTQGIKGTNPDFPKPIPDLAAVRPDQDILRARRYGYRPQKLTSTAFGTLPEGAAGQIEELIDQLERGRAVDIRQPTAVNMRAAERITGPGAPKWKKPTRPANTSDDLWKRLVKKKKKHHGQNVRAWKKMTADWEKLITSADRAEIATGLERNLASIKPQQLQMLMPAEELKAITPNDWLSMLGTGNPTSPLGEQRGSSPLDPTGSGPAARTRGAGWSGSGVGETIEDVWKMKLEESKLAVSTQEHGAGIYESVKAKGVKPTPMQYGSYTDTPIMVAHQSGGLPRRIAEGHHRVAAAADINPRMEVPFANVEYNPGGSWGPGHGINAVRSSGPPGEVPYRRIKQIVPNEDIVRQIAKFGRQWGSNALRLMMKVPK